MQIRLIGYRFHGGDSIRVPWPLALPQRLHIHEVRAIFPAELLLLAASLTSWEVASTHFASQDGYRSPVATSTTSLNPPNIAHLQPGRNCASKSRRKQNRRLDHSRRRSSAARRAHFSPIPPIATTAWSNSNSATPFIRRGFSLPKSGANSIGIAATMATDL